MGWLMFVLLKELCCKKRQFVSKAIVDMSWRLPALGSWQVPFVLRLSDLLGVFPPCLLFERESRRRISAPTFNRSAYGFEMC